MGARNWELWQGLIREERSRRLNMAFEPSGHLGALVALRDLGADACEKRLLTKCCGDLPDSKEARREAEVLRAAARAGLVPQSFASFPPLDYAKLRLVFRLNGFRFNGDLQEGDVGYDVGEVLFDKICRI